MPFFSRNNLAWLKGSSSTSTTSPNPPPILTTLDSLSLYKNPSPISSTPCSSHFSSAPSSPSPSTPSSSPSVTFSPTSLSSRLTSSTSIESDLEYESLPRSWTSYPPSPRTVKGRIRRSLSSNSWLEQGIREAAASGKGDLHVVMIGGVAGSELVLNGKRVWPNVGGMFIDGVRREGSHDLDFKGDADELQVGNLMRDIKVCGVTVKNFWKKLASKVASKHVKTHEYSYDFRRPVEELGPDFLAYLQDLKTGLPADDRLRIIAHSYGGLVAIDALSRADRLKDAALVEGVVTLGSPFLGSPAPKRCMTEGLRVLGRTIVRSETFASWPAMALLAAGSDPLRMWRDGVEERSAHSLLSAITVACVYGTGRTIADCASKVGDLGDGTVSEQSASSPPGVPLGNLQTFASSRKHAALPNTNRAAMNAFNYITARCKEVEAA